MKPGVVAAVTGVVVDAVAESLSLEWILADQPGRYELADQLRDDVGHERALRFSPADDALVGGDADQHGLGVECVDRPVVSVADVISIGADAQIGSVTAQVGMVGYLYREGFYALDFQSHSRITPRASSGLL